MSVAELEDEIVAAGAEIVWLLEQDASVQPGTAARCMETMGDLGSKDQGFCVGDDQTLPEAGTFDDSPFGIGRGFDMIVPRMTMEVVWTSSHGTPAGNDNVDGQAVLDAVEEAIRLLP